jgi:hypothetical protein
MPKSATALMVLLIFFAGQQGWAQLSSDQEKRLKDLETRAEALKDWEKDSLEQGELLMRPETMENEMEMLQKKDQDLNESVSGVTAGRYQAVRMDSNAIFILDTQEGHLWVWIIQKDNSGQSAEFLFYQGKVRPGSRMGELIDRTYQKGSERSAPIP